MYNVRRALTFRHSPLQPPFRPGRTCSRVLAEANLKNYFHFAFNNHIDKIYDSYRRGSRLTASSSTRTVSIMGIIMAVAAVFEIHIEMNIVTKNRPNVSLRK